MGFVEISLIFATAFIIGYLVNTFKQPPMIGYMITGVVLGPLLLNLIENTQQYTFLSELGIAFLLYIVGLHLNEREIKNLGIKPLIIGTLQILLTWGFSFLILINFLNTLPTLILSFCLSISSTIIIVKILADKEETDELYGKLLLAILLLQDIAVAIFLVVLSTFTEGQSSIAGPILLVFAKLIGTIIVLRIFVKLILEKIIDSIARNTELLFLFSIAWCFTVAALFHYINLSIEIGALAAGILIASNYYQPEISARVKPLRDFFLILFFLLLGTKIVSIQPSDLYLVLVLCILVLIIKPLITYITTKITGYPKEVGIISAMSMGQISAFSLIIILSASEKGIIPESLVGQLTLTMIISIIISSYLIKHNHRIFDLLVNKNIIKCEKNSVTKKEKKSYHTIIFGYDRIGFSLLKTIKKLNTNYIVIDYNPEVIKTLRKNKIECLFGNAKDIELIDELNLKESKLIISTIPEFETSKTILREARKKNINSTVILTSHNIEDALELYKQGADYIILPHFLGGKFAADLIEKSYDNLDKILKEKIKHLKELEKRKKSGSEHPAY